MRPGLLLLVCGCILRGELIEGDVVNSMTRLPIANVHVSLIGASSVDLTVVKTDASGHFRLSAPPQHVPYIQVIYPGFRTKQTSASGSNVHVELTPAAVLTGTVEDDDGFPVARSQVQAWRYRIVNGERKLVPEGGTQTDDRGQFRIGQLMAGRYWISVGSGDAGNWNRRYVDQKFPGDLAIDEQNPIEVQAGQERGGLTIRLTKHEGVKVSGIVEWPRGIAPSSYLSVSLQRGGVDLSIAMDFSYRDGKFTIRHVPPGTYTLRANSGNYPARAGDFQGKQTLNVGEAGERNVILTMREVQAVDLSGKVIAEGGDVPPLVTVALRATNGSGSSTTTGADGSFVLKGVVNSGDYSVMVQSREPPAPDGSLKGVIKGAFPVSVRLGNREVGRGSFELNGSATEQLQITVRPRIFVIQGKLLDAAGQPLTGHQLSLEGDRSAVMMASDGSFRAIVFRPGNYHVYLDAEDWTDLDDVKKHENDLPLLHVVDGENPPVTLRLR